MIKHSALVLGLGLTFTAAAWAQGVNPPVVQPSQNPPASTSQQNPPAAQQSQQNPPVATSIPSPIAPRPSLWGGNWEIFAGATGQFALAAEANSEAVDTTNVIGGTAAIRFHISDWNAVEARYAISFPEQTYGPYQQIWSRSTDLSMDYVATLPTSYFMQPYFLAGGGAIDYVPTRNNDASYAVSERRWSANVGVGLNIRVKPHLGVRVEYRAVMFRIPDFGGIQIFNWNYMSEPVIGLVYHF